MEVILNCIAVYSGLSFIIGLFLAIKYLVYRDNCDTYGYILTESVLVLFTGLITSPALYNYFVK